MECHALFDEVKESLKKIYKKMYEITPHAKQIQPLDEGDFETFYLSVFEVIVDDLQYRFEILPQKILKDISDGNVYTFENNDIKCCYITENQGSIIEEYPDAINIAKVKSPDDIKDVFVVNRVYNRLRNTEDST